MDMDFYSYVRNIMSRELFARIRNYMTPVNTGRIVKAVRTHPSLSEDELVALVQRVTWYERSHKRPYSSPREW